MRKTSTKNGPIQKSGKRDKFRGGASSKLQTEMGVTQRCVHNSNPVASALVWAEVLGVQ